jgi:hypothetical protein
MQNNSPMPNFLWWCLCIGRSRRPQNIYEPTLEATHENHAVGKRLGMERVHTSARYLSASGVGVAVLSLFQYGSGLRIR